MVISGLMQKHLINLTTQHKKNPELRKMKALIIGGGLAGIAVAEQLTARGVLFDLFCDRSQNSSTRIATGMYNPIVFRRLNLSWMVEDLLPEMHTFFERIEERLGAALKHPMSFEKHIPSNDYKQLWEKRLKEEVQHPDYMNPIADGYGPVKQAGMVDCKGLQEAYLQLLEEKAQLNDAHFIYSDLQLSADNTASYKGRVYDMVFFCEGPFALENPFFNWLPFNLCQGEWIIIQTEKELTNKVINNITNVIPLGNRRYKLSSTYSWKTLDGKPHLKEAEMLLGHFNDLFPNVSYRIVEHKAALRPTVADRRPYLGRHPAHPQLIIFNGLGSKGVMLAPYFSKHLIQHLLDDMALLSDVDIQRHIKRYQRSQE